MPNKLGLKSLNIIKEDVRDTEYYFIVESSVNPSECLKCGSSNFIGHGVKNQLFNDTTMHDKKVLIEVNRKRFRCKDCKQTFMDSLPEFDDKRLSTRRLVAHIERRSLDQTFLSIARSIGVNEKTVRNIFKDYIVRLEADYKLYAPKWLGIDEAHLGHKMGCVITDIENRRLIEIFEYRNKELLLKYLSPMPNKGLVEVVAIDMWEPYKDVAYMLFPKAKVVIDKFHVVRLASDALNNVRKSLTPKDGDKLLEGKTEKQKKKIKSDRKKLLFKGRLITLKHYNKLNLKQELDLESLLDNYPVLKMAHVAKESFYSIYTATDRQQAEDLYDSWRNGIEPDIKPFFGGLITSMRNWHTEIFNYFDAPITNAYTECVNGIIKIANRNGRGYSFEALRAKMVFVEPQITKPPVLRKKSKLSRLAIGRKRITLKQLDKAMQKAGTTLEVISIDENGNIKNTSSSE